ncbi:MAG: hypothetical protein DWB56_06725 [Candidatus Jettenia sp.]|uniref:Uncharacterized protein n=1 Tax=Candidatus Jettenia caeni TaxID=247490 RepID=I3IN08_9BACT|nr:hypothetical protein [Candidatus Jettenia sp. AMX1]MBC6928647.1 hypothetical protein [Candidatus Jettenia sp.]GAB63103.1 hypothetical protein KSU1_C1507 [Candidatus Jettenia caeni]KAA0250625.1 MAG: hypothetical protein EDM77_03665 [Candidatus Jettenia sp. AMX1]MCE7879959.1 hypothetical protein [Candidatus Jettenia sp. AMX1]MCQ3926741.1 hypothetical protein [Candidatus Jettenia sp.]
MASFTSLIDHIATTLQNNAPLTSFCDAKWGKALSVLKAFKQRIEINLNDLPVILITRPSLEKNFLVNITRDGAHTVRLYAGFHQTDWAKALNEMVEFEEKIDDALLTDYTRGGLAINTIPKSSVNDEGEFHPVYFIVMEVEIKHRR